ncbi:glycerate kinase [Sphingosinicella ginsenosidimutans]|uniref:Glycerate kinase n=2 Tax=Allosphingosinicella ginsenosidimutans TaxID=1176539 RepID=A0A5C6TX54_9SPHN|nr:glycerate kinase [Sphingosinicella ginsenosidimutans]
MMFDMAVASAQPANVIPGHLPEPPPGRLVVLGAGKASAAMARAVEDHWPGALSGLVVTRYGHAVPCRRIEIVEAGHPIPDEAGLDASRRMMAIAAGLGPDDLALCLMSGGGSALLAMPVPPLTLDDERALSEMLLRSGVPIGGMNLVRRHLSAIKGGRLAAACHPARVLSLLISDVPGDDPIDIASGPTVGDPTTCAEALALIDRHGLQVPAAARHLLVTGAAESVKPGDPRLARAGARIIAAPRLALEAAAGVARAAGLPVTMLGDAIEGEAREVARAMAARTLATARPCVLLSGGETTVTVRGRGRGGRNAEFLLALAIALDGAPGIHALAADTDGIDGVGEVAGAIIGPDSLARARALGIDPAAALADNDAHAFFAALGDGIVTGPTFTNVNDFRAILVA